MIRPVTDLRDEVLSAYRAVGDASALERAGLFVAEGRLIVERLLSLPDIHVHSVAVTPAAADALAALLERRPDVPVCVCAPAVLEAVTGFDFHRGCLALARRPATSLPLERFASSPRLIALEGVGNPDNVGGLFRAALAFGVDAVILDRATADPLYRKAIRTSMAATLRVPFARLDPWTDGLASLRASGLRVVALTPHSAAVPLDDYAARRGERIALVVGSEGFGMSPESMALADARVRIPIDPRADSLNVVTAAAIALHALRAPLD